MRVNNQHRQIASEEDVRSHAEISLVFPHHDALPLHVSPDPNKSWIWTSETRDRQRSADRNAKGRLAERQHPGFNIANLSSA